MSNDLTLYRAVAYRLERRDTPPAEQQPEVHVFVESAGAEAAPATLLRALAAAWSCAAPDIDFYNLSSEAELRHGAAPGTADMGDAQLLVSGWYHGPLFIRPDRTLMLVRPRTLARLHHARVLAEPWARQQRQASLRAAGLDRTEMAMRAGLMAEMACTVGGAA